MPKKSINELEKKPWMKPFKSLSESLMGKKENKLDTISKEKIFESTTIIKK